MAKRLASDLPPSVPPQKLAKRIHKMQIETPMEMDTDMDGIESPDFYHVSRKDWLDAVNEIDVDDRFTRIPQEVRVKPYFERPTNALIRYTPKPKPNEPNEPNELNELTQPNGLNELSDTLVEGDDDDMT